MSGTAPTSKARSRARWLALAAGVVGGAAGGEATWRGAVEAAASRAPPDWTEQAPDVPMRLGSLMGRVAPDPDAWSLDFWRTLWPDDPHLRSGPAPIQATVRIPEDGQVELWTALPRRGADAGGVALVLERVGEGSSRVVQQVRGGRRAVSCDAALPPMTGAATPVRIEPMPNGVEVEVDGVSTLCLATLPQSGPALRAGLRRVQVRDLVVGQVPVPAPGPHLRLLWWAGGAALCVGLVALELWSGAAAALVALTTLPLLLAAAFLGVDVRTFAETARVTWLPVPWLAALGPAMAALVAKATHHLARLLREAAWLLSEPDRDWPWAAPLAAAVPSALAIGSAPGALGGAAAAGLGLAVSLGAGACVVVLLGWLGSLRPRRTATIVVAFGTLVACAMGLAGPLHRLAPALAGVAALAIGGVIWANVNASRARAFNLTSLALVVGALAATEGSVRYTQAGVAWSATGARTRPDDIYGWVPQATETFALMEAGQHTDYPDKGYPVAISADAGRPRVVAMGGSTTGGAFQNDDLADFYPARMGELLGERVQVLNQGVGGWTTWHIRRYLSDHLDALNPDVLTLYVGHNDLLTPAPVPYAQLYTAWRGPGWGQDVGRVLGQLRLYQALRYGLSALRPPGQRVAVPVADARENLLDIAGMVTERGGRVVLASEGLAPDPGPLAGYNAMMRGLADGLADVSYIDVAGRLHGWEGERVFLDDCHLTETGHRMVADAFVAELRRLGVVEEAHAQP